jgi:flagellar FliL protein
MAKEKEKEKGPEEGQTSEEGQKKSSKKMLIIIIAVAVLLVGGAAGAYFLMFNKPKDEKTEAAAKKEEKKDDGVNFPLDPFVVNLADQGANKFLKISVQLELSGTLVQEKAKSKVPQLRDAVITLLTSKSSDALMTPEGKLQLKDEINVRATQILGPNSVKNVYLTDFVMQ